VANFPKSGPMIVATGTAERRTSTAIVGQKHVHLGA